MATLYDRINAMLPVETAIQERDAALERVKALEVRVKQLTTIIRHMRTLIDPKDLGTLGQISAAVNLTPTATTPVPVSTVSTTALTRSRPSSVTRSEPGTDMAPRSILRPTSADSGMLNKASPLESPSQHAVHFSRGDMLGSTKRFHGRRNLAETLQPLETRKPSVTKNGLNGTGGVLSGLTQRPLSSGPGGKPKVLAHPEPFRLRTVGRRGTRFNYSFDEDAEDMTVVFKPQHNDDSVPTPVLGVTLVSTSLPKLPTIAITTAVTQKLRQVASAADVRHRL